MIKHTLFNKLNDQVGVDTTQHLVDGVWTASVAAPYKVFASTLVKISEHQFFQCGGYHSGDINLAYIFDFETLVWTQQVNEKEDKVSATVTLLLFINTLINH